VPQVWVFLICLSHRRCLTILLLALLISKRLGSLLTSREQRKLFVPAYQEQFTLTKSVTIHWSSQTWDEFHQTRSRTDLQSIFPLRNTHLFIYKCKKIINVRINKPKILPLQFFNQNPQFTLLLSYEAQLLSANHCMRVRPVCARQIICAWPSFRSRFTAPVNVMQSWYGAPT
jgi:hypothetical protein